MSNIEDYEVKIDVINSIEDKDVKTPNMPVGNFIQESENLYTWSLDDKDALVAAGLDWKLVKDMPVRAGALREAESCWFSHRFKREEARKLWVERSPEAYDLRDQLLHAFTYAYRKNPDILARVSALREGSTNADMIQDLNNIAVIGRENPEPLKKIRFDMALIEKAAETADEMGALLAYSNAEDDDSETLKIRNKAYTHLKEAVDEIRDCGRYVFWRNRERIKGYGSQYLRRVRNNYEHRNNEDENANDTVAE